MKALTAYADWLGRRALIRTVLSRHNLHRTYQGAVAKLADPAVPLRPTARRVLQAFRDGGPQRVEQLAARLNTSGRRPIRPATVAGAPGELHAAGLAAVDVEDQDVTAGRWSAVPAARDPLLEAVELHGAHEAWLPVAAGPARPAVFGKAWPRRGGSARR